MLDLDDRWQGFRFGHEAHVFGNNESLAASRAQCLATDFVEPNATVADPTNLTSGDTHNESVRRNIFRDDGAGADESVFADSHATDDC